MVQYKVPEKMKAKVRGNMIKSGTRIPDFQALSEAEWHALAKQWCEPEVKPQFPNMRKGLHGHITFR